MKQQVTDMGSLTINVAADHQREARPCVGILP